MTEGASRGEPPRFVRELTVARVRDEADHAEVIFLESARFYRLPKADPRFDSLLALLRRALEEQRPVRVEQASADSDLIADVQLP